MTTDTPLPPAIARLRAWAANERLGDARHLTQQRIDTFANATDDHNWLHVDEKRAAREVPGGRTIAHGYLLLALTAADDVAAMVDLPGVARLINYGLNKVRFLMPAPSGATVRVRSRLLALSQKEPGRWLMTQHKQVELPTHEVIAIAEQLTLIELSTPTG
ncbi:MAG: MaoC/PaaZ C-terminal domain-containing protein [Thermomonas sp.]|uniref:MaoC/PaaZ C-terminal domain-containing protein n=1 Tax=Thermomonas sp. TaxID=1971895 RepID=UPI0039E5F8B0